MAIVPITFEALISREFSCWNSLSSSSALVSSEKSAELIRLKSLYHSGTLLCRIRYSRHISEYGSGFFLVCFSNNSIDGVLVCAGFIQTVNKGKVQIKYRFIKSRNKNFFSFFILKNSFHLRTSSNG